MLLYVVRHGDPVYDPDMLTPLGKRQAEAVGKRLSVHGLDKIYSSPNVRARETAQPAAEMLHLEVEIAPWTSEDLAWHDFRRMSPHGHLYWSFSIPADKLLADPAILGDSWYESPVFDQTNAKNGYDRIVRDSDEFFKNLGYVREGLLYRIENPKYKRVAVFCHGGFGSTWLGHVFGIHPIRYWNSFDMTHSGVTVIWLPDSPSGYTCPKCLTLSDTGHLYHEGLPLRYNNFLDI